MRGTWDEFPDHVMLVDVYTAVIMHGAMATNFLLPLLSVPYSLVKDIGQIK